MSYLITLTIGPVQSYIRQARRTQDLWQGSRILSHLARTGVHYAEKQPNIQIIYPHPESDNIPNRMVLVWNGDETGAHQCARDIENIIRKTWQQISTNTMHHFTRKLDADEQENILHIWQRQEESWLECYWVVTPYNSQQHQQSIQLANQAMGSRKLLRAFPQIDEKGRKCSITGEHEALHIAGDHDKLWDSIRKNERNLSIVGQHERLSAISTIKRFAHEANKALSIESRYPSTSSIAASTFKYDVLSVISKLDSTALLSALEGFIQSLLKLFDKPDQLFFMKNGKYNPEKFPFIENNIPSELFESELIQQFMSIDGDFLFEDTLIAKTIEEYSGKNPNPNDLAKAKKALAQLIKQASIKTISQPEPYFVILSMDGDNMGKTLGTLSREQHAQFSQTLADFARKDVPRIVEQTNLGRVVYAGGDDVLAVLPVRNALQIANQLRDDFQNRISQTGITNHEGKPLTASTGLAYVHHTHNLQEAVNVANHAQSIAKDKLNRNALFIEFLRRSGEPRSMGGKWDNGQNSLTDQISALISAYQEGLSHNLPYDVAQIAYSMGNDVPLEAVKAELGRVIKRRLPPNSPSAQVDKLTAIILDLQKENGWENTKGWLELARFINQRTGEDNA